MTTPTTKSPTTSATSARTVSSFCAALKTLIAKYPKDASTNFEALSADYNRLAAQAPTEVRQDLNVVTAALRQVAAGNYSAASGKAYTNASTHLETWGLDKCGIPRQTSS